MIDTGEFVGTEILYKKGDLGLKFMRSLPNPYKLKVQIFMQMRDPDILQTGDLIKDRW